MARTPVRPALDALATCRLGFIPGYGNSSSRYGIPYQAPRYVGAGQGYEQSSVPSPQGHTSLRSKGIRVILVAAADLLSSTLRCGNNDNCFRMSQSSQQRLHDTLIDMLYTKTIGGIARTRSQVVLALSPTPSGRRHRSAAPHLRKRNRHDTPFLCLRWQLVIFTDT